MTVTVNLAPLAKQRFVDNNGVPLAGGKVFTYQAGTTTKQATYTDSTGSTPNANPVLLDSRGEASIWLDQSLAYKIVVAPATDTDPPTNPIWTIDGIPAAGFLPAFIASLAASGGSSLVGFISALAGAVARTVQDKERDIVAVRDFGVLHNDGVTDDSAIFQLALNSGARHVVALGVNCRIGTTLTIPANVTLYLFGSKLTMVGTAFTMFSATTVSDWAILGPCDIVGDLVTDPGTGVSSKGVAITDCGRYTLRDLHFKNIKGYGVWVDPGGSTRARADGGNVDNCSASACVWGWNDNAGTGSEYLTVINWRGTQNAQCSIQTTAGNITFLGGHSIDNVRDGVRLAGGSNNCHGSFQGHFSNHNPSYNWWANGVTNGETFNGCHSYSSATGQGLIYFQNSVGMHWDGGSIDSYIYNDSGGSSGANRITGAYMPGDIGVTLNTNVAGSLAQLFLDSNYTKTGMSALNDPAPLFVRALRSTNQTLTAGSPIVAIFDTKSLDNRTAYNSGTGVYTTPTGFGGEIHTIEVNIAVTAASGIAAGGLVEIRVNGAVVGNGGLVAISGTLATYQGSISAVPAAGQTIDVRVTANSGAVTPVLSSSANSWLVIRSGN